MFDEDRDDPQQSHADREIRFLHGRRRRGAAAAALTELDVGREQLDDQRTHALLQQETELLMLHTETRREHKVRERSEGRQLGTSHFLLFICHPSFRNVCFHRDVWGLPAGKLQESHLKLIPAAPGRTSGSSRSFPLTSRGRRRSPADTNPAERHIYKYRKLIKLVNIYFKLYM